MLQKLNPIDFDKAFSLLEASFPLDEYRTYEEQKALLSNSLYTIYILNNDVGTDIKALVTLWQFPEFSYIEHLATNPHYRNQGLGALILKELQELLPTQICLEVELPEAEMACRRIGFYERNGFFLNKYPYIQPPYSQDRKEIPLLIMTSKGMIDRETFERMKETLYREVYKK